MSTNERPPQLDPMQQSIVYAIDQAMTPIRKTLDQHDDDIRMLMNTIYGNPKIGIHGVIELIDEIKKQLAELLDQRNDVRTILKVIVPLITFAIPIISALVAEGLKRWLFP